MVFYGGYICLPHFLHIEQDDVVIELPVSKINPCFSIESPIYKLI